MKRLIPYALLLAAAVVLGGDENTRAAGDDQRIQAAARDTYVFRRYLKDDDITVEAVDGTVKLTGTVAEDSHKVLAETTVQNLPGVNNVVDQLQAPVADHPVQSDEWINTTVKFALLFHSSLSTPIRVRVEEAVVTLTGVAGSDAAKRLATDCAQGVAGVKGVNNNMTVVPSPPPPPLIPTVDDASITAQVRVVLLLDRYTNGLHPINITTVDGAVTVRGIAPSQAEVNLVSRLINDIPGVVQVQNQTAAGG
jgi:osmotically-inducible protein OsmY